MQDLKIYIVIEDPKTRQDVSIRGNFDVLRAFLSGVGTLEIQDAPNSSPLAPIVPVIHSVKRKPAKEKSILTA
ncbi:MAG: hypothetical protein NTW69_16335 [Chloroflexi bacterium]|nr:hypothetical protein [Chloroflexota bacterium]